MDQPTRTNRQTPPRTGRGLSFPASHVAGAPRRAPLARGAALPLVVAGLLWAAAVAAETGVCPPHEPDTARQAALMDALRAAPDAATARPLSNQLWEIWTDAPDAHAQDLLNSGMSRRAGFDLANALSAFDALVAYCPDYAEGYNQRAFVRFIAQDYAAALPDLDRALDLNPVHLGALTGRAMTLMALDRNAEALRDLEAALAIHPWLAERDLLPVLKERLGQTDL